MRGSTVEHCCLCVSRDLPPFKPYIADLVLVQTKAQVGSTLSTGRNVLWNGLYHLLTKLPPALIHSLFCFSHPAQAKISRESPMSFARISRGRTWFMQS